MASNELKIPTIDFCKPELKPGTSQWESIKTQVFKALQEYGCFEAIYDKVPNETREAIFDTSKEVLPLKAKLKEYLEKPYHCYDGQIPHFPFYDNIVHAADLLLPGSVETFANTFWPDGNPNYCNVLKSYYKPLVELDEMVKMMVLESLGLTSYIDEFLDASNVFSMRLMQYFKAARGEDWSKLGLPGHTDAGFLTIVKQKQVGLQVLKNDDEWVDLNASPNSYVVLSADSFMAWTNGRLQSATHRVIMKGDSDRFSIQLFSSPKPGCTIEAPKELVDEEHPLLFKPYDIVGYYEYIMLGAKAGVGLRAYNGV